MLSIPLMLALFAVFLVIGVPVAITLGSVSLVFILQQGLPLSLIGQRMFVGLDSFPLMALPLFLLAGNLMNNGGITDRLWKFARTMVGFIPGGMGHVSVVSSMLFASMSGSALATAGGLGPIQIKGMEEDGFERDMAAAITAAASTIGPIIPPSIVFVLYGVLGGVSVGKMFLAGILPGILMGISLMIYIFFMALANKGKFVVQPLPTIKSAASAFVEGFFPLLAPVIILGGIMNGYVTPTEAAAIASVYSLILGFAFRQMDIATLVKVFKDTARSSASIMLIIGLASGFSWMLTSMGAARMFVAFVSNSNVSTFTILLLLNLALIVVGCFIETNSAVVLLTPLLVPAMVAVGIDPVHLGIILCVNLLIGILTPPMGMSIYVVSRVSNTPFHKVVRKVIPLLASLLVALLLITYVPQVSLFIPNLLMP
jgi:tripartite ATP-independent transporter DctM subunit